MRNSNFETDIEQLREFAEFQAKINELENKVNHYLDLKRTIIKYNLAFRTFDISNVCKKLADQLELIKQQLYSTHLNASTSKGCTLQRLYNEKSDQITELLSSVYGIISSIPKMPALDESDNEDYDSSDNEGSYNLHYERPDSKSRSDSESESDSGNSDSYYEESSARPKAFSF